MNLIQLTIEVANEKIVKVLKQSKEFSFAGNFKECPELMACIKDFDKECKKYNKTALKTDADLAFIMVESTNDSPLLLDVETYVEDLG